MGTMDTPSEKKQIELASAYYTKGRKLWSKGERDNALELFRKALSIQEAVLGTYNKQTARTYYWVGYALSHKSEYDKALVAYRRALRIRLFLLGENDASTEDVKRALRDLLSEKGFHTEGIEEYLKDVSAAVQHEKAAIDYESRGSHSHTVEEYEKCLTIEGNAQGSFPVDIARTYSKIADIHRMHNENDMAIAAYRNALTIFSAILGRRHSDSSNCIKGIEACARSKGLPGPQIEQYKNDVFDSIALVREGDEMAQSGKIDVAAQKYDKAIELEESSLGKEPLSTAEIHRRLASCYQEVKEYDRSIQELRTALTIFIFDNGENHHTVISCLRELRAILKENGSTTADINKYMNTVSYSVKYERYGKHILKEGDFKGAILEFEKAMSLEESALGKYHLTQAALFRGIAVAFDSQGQHDHAIVNYRNALLICQPKLGVHHPTTVSILGELQEVANRKGIRGNMNEAYGMSTVRSITSELEAEDLLKHGDRERAIAAFQKAVTYEEESLGQYHLCTSDLYGRMADLLNSIGQYDRALVKYRDLLAVNQQAHGLKHRNSKRALEGLARILTVKRLDPKVALRYAEGVVDSIKLEQTGDDQAKHGLFERAISSYREAMEIEKNILGESYLTTAGIYSKVADTYRLRKQYTRSILIYRKAIRIYQFYKVPNNGEIDTAMKRLGWAVQGLGFDENIIEKYKKAIQESLKLEADGDTAQHGGNNEKAISKFRLAIDEEENVLGKLFPTTSSMYKKIADICRDKEDFESALLFYSKVLAIEESHLGKEHEETLTSYNQLVNVSQRYGTSAGAFVDGWTFLKYVLMGIIGLLVLIISIAKSMSNKQRTIKKLTIRAYQMSDRARSQEAQEQRRAQSKPRRLEPPEERYTKGGDWGVEHSDEYSSGEVNGNGDGVEREYMESYSAVTSDQDGSYLDQADAATANLDGMSFAQGDTEETAERKVNDYEYEGRTEDSIEPAASNDNNSSSTSRSVESPTPEGSRTVVTSKGAGSLSVRDRLAAYKAAAERPRSSVYT
eukprot:scaffold1398_cov116-Cylindrotheca_fusiformis.AAC.4